MDKRKDNQFQVSTPLEPLTTSHILPKSATGEKQIEKAKSVLKDLPIRIEGSMIGMGWNFTVAYPEKGQEHINRCTKVGIVHYALNKLITLDEELTEEQEEAIWLLKKNKFILTYMPTLGLMEMDSEEDEE